MLGNADQNKPLTQNGISQTKFSSTAPSFHCNWENDLVGAFNGAVQVFNSDTGVIGFYFHQCALPSPVLTHPTSGYTSSGTAELLIFCIDDSSKPYEEKYSSDLVIIWLKYDKHFLTNLRTTISNAWMYLLDSTITRWWWNDVWRRITTIITTLLRIGGLLTMRCRQLRIQLQKLLKYIHV